MLSSSVPSAAAVYPYGAYTTYPTYNGYVESSTLNPPAGNGTQSVNGQPTPADEIPSLKPIIIDRR
jgi:hypothetical protein